MICSLTARHEALGRKQEKKTMPVVRLKSGLDDTERTTQCLRAGDSSLERMWISTGIGIHTFRFIDERVDQGRNPAQAQ